MSSPTRWELLQDPAEVAQEATYRILRAAEAAIAERDVFRIALSGGQTPEHCYSILAKSEADWPRWQIYFGDERCVPPDHRDRNSLMVSRAWLDHVPIPAVNVHPIPAERGAESAAREYEPLVRSALPFDLVLLGMGEDGHTAALFPGRAHTADELVHAVHDAPKPPPDRVTLSVAALSNARQVMILITGASKRPTVEAWCRGECLPIMAIRALTSVDILIDKQAGLY